MTVRLVLVAVLGLGALAGCGQKGPLYRPEEAPQDQTEQLRAGDARATSRLADGAA